jgi:hypothetical protein
MQKFRCQKTVNYLFIKFFICLLEEKVFRPSWDTKALGRRKEKTKEFLKKEKNDFQKYKIAYCLTLDIQQLLHFGIPVIIPNKNSTIGPQHWKYNRNIKRVPHGVPSISYQPQNPMVSRRFPYMMSLNELFFLKIADQTFVLDEREF